MALAANLIIGRNLFLTFPASDISSALCLAGTGSPAIIPDWGVPCHLSRHTHAKNVRMWPSRTGPHTTHHTHTFTITEKAPTRALSWLKAPTSAFTFKTLLRHYAKQVLTPRSLNVKLGPRRNYHKGRAAIRHYANQPARPF